MSNPFDNIGAVEPVEGAGALIGKLVCLRPLREITGERLNPALPPRDITVCYALEVTETDNLGQGQFAYEDHGEVKIMWSVIRRQLAKATTEIPWVMGRPQKAGNSYVLRPPTPQEASWCKRALTEAQRLYSGSED